MHAVVQDFSGLISEYVHSVSQQEEAAQPTVAAAAAKVWASLKRSTKAGARRSVSCGVGGGRGGCCSHEGQAGCAG